MTQQKQEARASIRAANYTGKGNFTFARYISIFAEAFAELERLEEPMPESQKITEFLDGIQCPQLETHKKIVEGDEEKMNDFTKCQQFLQTCVNKAKLKSSRGRNIAGVGTQEGPKGKQGQKSNRKRSASQITRRRYSNAEWKALSDEDKAKVRAAREAAKKKRGVAKAETTQQQAAAATEGGLISALRQLVTEQGTTGPNGQKSMTISISSTNVEEGGIGKAQKNAEPKKNAGHQFGRKGTVIDVDKKSNE